MGTDMKLKGACPSVIDVANPVYGLCELMMYVYSGLSAAMCGRDVNSVELIQ